MDSSKDGLVYFSLGTNVVCKNLRKDLLEDIVEALGHLPYNVLWKYEEEDFPGKPPNVMTRKWLPQQDILGNYLQIGTLCLCNKLFFSALSYVLRFLSLLYCNQKLEQKKIHFFVYMMFIHRFFPFTHFLKYHQ